MPVKSSSASVLRWPDGKNVREALQDWVKRVRAEHPEILRIGYFGSYARGDWGVGSDLDLVVVVGGSERIFAAGLPWLDTTSLPVPVDLLTYSEEEFSGVSLAGVIWLLSMND